MITQPPVTMTQYDLFEVQDDGCTVNGDYIHREQELRLREYVIDEFPIITSCPFCSTIMLTTLYEWTSDDEENGQDSTLWSCPNCAYWQWFFHSYTMGIPASVSWDAWISKARYFNDCPEFCRSELAQAIRRNRKLWHEIEPYKLEKLVAAVFKSNYADCEVMHVGKSDDGGVDVVFIDSDKLQTLIQVKRHTHSHASEGVGTVRSLLGAMLLKGALRGIVVSTADHFTYRAYEAIGRAKEIGMAVDLIDRGKLNRMLDPLIPDKPWLPVVRQNAPELASYFAKKFVVDRGTG